MHTPEFRTRPVLETNHPASGRIARATASPRPASARRAVLVLAGSIAALLAAQPLHAGGVTHVTSTTGAWNWSTSANWTNGIPNAAGDSAQYNSGTASATTTLDQAATLGRLYINNNQGWTINADASPGIHFLTLDNTGGVVNGFGTSNASIYASIGLSAALVINPNIVISNTDLDVGLLPAVNTSNGLTINGNMTATTDQNLFLRNNAGSLATVTIAGSIGASGNAIAIQNASTAATGVTLSGAIGGATGTGAAVTIANNATGTGTLTISGSLGATVSSVTQSTATSQMTLSGANTAFTGVVNLNSGTLSIASQSAFGDGVLNIADNASIDRANAGVGVLTGNFSQVWNSSFKFVGTTAMDMGTSNVSLGADVTVTLAGVNGRTLTIGGVISGAHNLTAASGATVLLLTGANTYSGTTTVSSGGLSVATSTVGTGSLNSTSGVTITGTTSKLTLDNTVAASERLNDSATVTVSNGGEFAIVNNATSGVQTRETIGGLTVDSGNSVVTLSGSAGTVLDALAIGATGFARLNNGTALIRGSSLGSTATNATRVTIDGTNGTGLTYGGSTVSSADGAGGGSIKNLRIIPYLFGSTSATQTLSSTSGVTVGAASAFLTYDTNSATGGLRLLATNEMDLLTTSYTTVGNNVTSALSGANTLTAGSREFNSLMISSNPALTAGNAADTLTIDSGAIATSGANMSLNGFSKIVLGNGEGIIDVFESTATMTVNSPVDVTSGGGLTKAGVGVLVLGASNLYTGQTTINQGTLRIGVGTAGDLGSNTAGVAVNSGATLGFGRSDTISFSNLISGTGNVTQSGSGTLTLTNANTYSGLTTASTGTLVLAGSNSSAGATTASGGVIALGAGAGSGLASGLLTVGSNGTIESSDNNPRTISNALAFITSSTSNLGGGAGRAGDLTFTGTLTVPSSVTLSIASGVTVTFTSGFGTGVTKTGAGTMILAGTGNANMTVSQGTLKMASTGTTAAGGWWQVGSGGTWDLNGTSQTLQYFFTGSGMAGTLLNSAVGTTSLLTLTTGNSTTPILSGLIEDNAGTGGVIAIKITGGSYNITGTANTYSGGTSLAGNGVTSFANGALGSGNVTWTGSATLQWNGTNTQDISNKVQAIASGATATMDTNGNNVTFANPLSGAGGLGKSGNGMLTLTGAQAYSGTTTVNLGTLKLAANSTLKSGDALTTATATAGVFDLNGNSQTLGTVTNGAASTITNGGGLATLTIGGGSTGAGAWTGAMNIVWNQGNTASTISGSVNNNGTITNSGIGTAASTFSGVIGSNVQGVIQASTTSALTLSGANLYTSATTINAGTLNLGNGTTGSLNGTAGTDLVFNGTGTFNVSEAAGTTQGMTSLAINAGDATVQSTFTATSAALTIASAARATGATANFVASAGVNGSTNSINLSDKAAGFIDQGSFFGGNNYAYMNAAGTYVRGINWGVDSGSTTQAGGASIASTAFAQTTAAVTAQDNATFTALNIVNSTNSAQAFTLGTGKTVTTNGILRSGNGGTSSTTTISGGTALQAGNNAELVIRTDLANDLLTINTPIVANGVNPLTKSGLGTVTLGGSNTFVGTVSVNGGTLAFSTDANLGNAGNSIVLSGGTLKSTAAVNLTRPIALNTAGSLSTSAALQVSGNVTGSGTLSIVGGSILLSGNNSYNATALGNATRLLISSDANLGGASSGIVWSGQGGATLTVLGTQFTTFGSHAVTWGVPTNNGSLGTLEIQDPTNTFVFNQNDTYTMNSGNPNLTITGQGTVRFTVAESFNDTTGAALIMNGGTVVVDQAAGGSLAGGNIVFGGGTLYLLGKTSGTTTQSFGSLTNNNAAGSGVLAGGGTIVADANNGTGTTTLSLGAIATTTFAANGSSLNIKTLNGTGGGTAIVTTTSTNDATLGASGAAGILGAGRVVYGTVDNADWAINTTNVSGGAIGGYSSYQTVLPGSGADGTTNYALTGNGSVTASESVNTLKVIGSAGGSSLGITTGQVLTINTGGLLFTGSANYQIGDGTNNGTLKSGTATTSDLVVSQYGSGVLTINSIIANGNGASTLTKAGPGKLILTAANTYTGATYVNGGVLSVSNINQLGNTATSALNLNGGTLQYTGASIATTHTIGLGGNGGTFDIAAGSVLTLSGVVSGLGLTINNSDGGNGTIILNAANTFTGGLWINAGVVQLNNVTAMPAAGFNTLTFGAAATAMLQLNSRSSTVAGLTSPSANAIVENANASTGATLSVDNGADNTFAGVLRDGAESVAGSKSLALAKTGGGALTLAGANTYTGATAISGGTVVVSGSISGSTAVTVSAANLLLSGSGDRLSDATTSTVNVSQGSTLGYASGLSGKSELAGGLSLSGGATLDFGNGNTNTLTFNGLTLTGTLTVKNWSGNAYNPGDTIDLGLIIAPNQDRLLFNTDPGFALGTEIASINFYDDTGVFLGHGEEVNLGGKYEIVAVPEPTSVTLLGAAGLLGVAGFRRRRRAPR